MRKIAFGIACVACWLFGSVVTADIVLTAILDEASSKNGLVDESTLIIEECFAPQKNGLGTSDINDDEKSLSSDCAITINLGDPTTTAMDSGTEYVALVSDGSALVWDVLTDQNAAFDGVAPRTTSVPELSTLSFARLSKITSFASRRRN